MKGKKYDYKQAYNTKLKPSARLHYLENARHDTDSPAKQVMDPSLAQQPQSLMSNVPPKQANTLGQAQPVFNPQAQQVAQVCLVLLSLCKTL